MPKRAENGPSLDRIGDTYIVLKGISNLWPLNRVWWVRLIWYCRMMCHNSWDTQKASWFMHNYAKIMLKLRLSVIFLRMSIHVCLIMQDTDILCCCCCCCCCLCCCGCCCCCCWTSSPCSEVEVICPWGMLQFLNFSWGPQLRKWSVRPSVCKVENSYFPTEDFAETWQLFRDQ